MKIKHALAGILGLAAAVAASNATAAPITSWDYTVSSVFSAATFTTGEGSQVISNTTVSWGNGAAERSSIGISNTPRVATLQTDGAAGLANTYTHNNRVLSGTLATLKTATITARLGLRESGTTGDYTYFEATYDILFAETPNVTPCVAASPAGNPCNDIWVLSGSLNRTFTVGDYEYYFSFYAAPDLDRLPDDVCDAAGASSGCHGFTTVEGEANAVNFLLKITSDRLTIPGGEVPEPATLALMGAGLLGMAGLRRQRRRN